MATATYSFNFGERGMSDEQEYTITVYGDSIPSNAIIQSGSFTFTIGLSEYSSDETMRLRKFYINSSENYIGYGKAYGDSTWWDTSNRVYFSGDLVISNSSPSAFIYGSFTLLLQLSYGGTFSGVNGREGTITINYTVPPPASVDPPSAPTLSIDGSDILISWSPAVCHNCSGNLYYKVLLNGDEAIVYEGPNLSTKYTFSKYNTVHSFSVVACLDEYGIWSYGASTSITTPKAASHYTIRFFDGNEWKNCLIYYYNGSDWIECTTYYYDGTSWKTCSF